MPDMPTPPLSRSSLVSVVVRSMGRPELHQALASIAAQTWREVEAIVVAACGPGHPPPPERLDHMPIAFAGSKARLTRPQAANAGLAAARGDFVGFLDDDDLFLPPHVETLLTALHAAPASPAAYAVAREVDAHGTLVRRRGVPFSRLLLHQVCFTVPGAMILRRQALDRCRFDETFELCEDWDFFLQLAQLGDFAFVPVETLVYRSTLGTSGTTAMGEAADPLLRHHAARLARKWEAQGREVAAAVVAASSRLVALFEARRFTEAEAMADQLLTAYPYEVAALNVKGTLLALRGDLQGALERFRVAVDEAPRDVASRFNLAQTLERAHQWPEALAAYDQVLALAPHHGYAAGRKAMLEREAANPRRGS
jgi:tetratricopeptide (TPR) repeat protein